MIAEELLDKMQREGRAPATLTKTRWLLEFAFAMIGERPIGKVTDTHQRAGGPLSEVQRKYYARLEPFRL